MDCHKLFFKEKFHIAVELDGRIYTNTQDMKLKTEQTDYGFVCQYELGSEIVLTVCCREENYGFAVNGFISYIGEKKIELSWVEAVLSEVSFDGIENDRFYSPGQGHIMKLSQNINFHQGCRVEEMKQFITEEDMYSTTPDKGAGILIVESADKLKNIALTAYSDNENFFPMTRVKASGIDLIQRNMVVADLSRFRRVEFGTIYVISANSYKEILKKYKEILEEELDLKAPECPKWVANGAILEVHASHFGGFSEGISQIEKWKNIGIKTIYLMPCLKYPNFMENGKYIHGYRSSGAVYSILDYYQIDPLSGGEDAFHEFVKKLHDEGMKILFDLVPQGASTYGTLYLEKPEWFERNEEGEMFSSHGWTNTYSLDWANPEVQKFFLDIACYYVREFNIDGFRIDAPHWKEPNKAENIPYHASRTCFGSVRLMAQILEETRKIKPDIFLLSEVWGAIFQNITHMQCEYNIHWALYHTGTGFYTGKELQYWMRDYEYTQVSESGKVTFLETHDTQLLTPMAQRFRGSMAMSAMMEASVFMGHIPMIWYEELPAKEKYYKHLLSLRRKFLKALDGSADYDKVWCDHEDIFAASRNQGRQLIFLTSTNRTVVHTRLYYEQTYFKLDPGVVYEFYNWETEKPLAIFEKCSDGKIRERTEIPENCLYGIELDLLPFTSYWLELREKEAK